MTREFSDKEAEAIWNGRRSRLPGDICIRALLKLQALDAAVRVEDLRVPPGNRLEALKGDRAGQHSIRINDQWRICFAWDGTDAHKVEITDYH